MRTADDSRPSAVSRTFSAVNAEHSTLCRAGLEIAGKSAECGQSQRFGQTVIAGRSVHRAAAHSLDSRDGGLKGGRVICLTVALGTEVADVDVGDDIVKVVVCTRNQRCLRFGGGGDGTRRTAVTNHVFACKVKAVRHGEELFHVNLCGRYLGMSRLIREGCYGLRGSRGRGGYDGLGIDCRLIGDIVDHGRLPRVFQQKLTGGLCQIFVVDACNDNALTDLLDGIGVLG